MPASKLERLSFVLPAFICVVNTWWPTTSDTTAMPETLLLIYTKPVVGLGYTEILVAVVVTFSIPVVTGEVVLGFVAIWKSILVAESFPAGAGYKVTVQGVF